MKTYLAVVTLVGIAALGGVVLSNTSSSAEESMMMQATHENAADAAPVSDFAKDHAECLALASAAGADGIAPTESQKTGALNKCLLDKGHSADEIATEAAAQDDAAPVSAPEKGDPDGDGDE